MAARLALLVAKRKGTSTEDLLRHCCCAKWATLSKDCAKLRGRSGCILAPFGFRWSSSSKKCGEILSCTGVSCQWTATSLVPTLWASANVEISGWSAIRPRRSSGMARRGNKMPTCLDMFFQRGLAGVRRAHRRLCVVFQWQTAGFCAQFQVPLRSVTSPPLCKVATSHFGASDRRAGASASRPFWSRGAPGETTPGPADGGALSVSDGASTFVVDARDLRRLEIPAALVPRLLSNAGASPSRAPSPHPQAPTEDPWGWLSLAGLASAMEDSIPVAADAVPHVVGKGGHTAQLIEEITGVIVGVGDRGDREAYVMLFGPERRVDAAMVIVRVVVVGGLGPFLAV